MATKSFAFLALAAVGLFAMAACGDDNEPDPTPTSSTSTVAPATTTGIGIVTETASPPPQTPAAPLNHPTSTRTGVPDLDRVLDALFSGDAAQFRALFELTPSPCVVNPQGIHNPPACPEGVASGTLLPVFRALAGEAVWPGDLDSGLAAWLARRHEVHAIYRGAPPATNGWIPAAEYAIVLADLDLSPMFASEVGSLMGKSRALSSAEVWAWNDTWRV